MVILFPTKKHLNGSASARKPNRFVEWKRTPSKKFVEYAKEQGSTHADNYYMNFTKLVQNHLGISPASRDNQDQRSLLRLKSMETIVDMHLETLMREKLPYKEVYGGVKNLIQSI